MPRAARGVPAPKERGTKQTVKKSISLVSFEFNAFVSVRSDLVRNPGSPGLLIRLSDDGASREVLGAFLDRQA